MKTTSTKTIAYFQMLAIAELLTAFPSADQDLILDMADARAVDMHATQGMA